MNSKLKKAVLNISLIIFMLMLSMSMLFISFHYGSEKNSAEAANDDLAFTVEAGIYDESTGTWTPYNDGNVSQYNISFRFDFTSDNANPSITEFSYVDGSSYSNVQESTEWKTHGEDNFFLRPENMMTDDMMIWTYPVTEPYDRFIKFRATAETTSGSGQPITEEYNLDNIYNIVYDNTVSENDIMINSVEATYKSGSTWRDYVTVLGDTKNIWVSTQIRFEITSKNIELGGTIKEKFYYSVDGLDVTDSEKEWHPATENVCILEQNINGPIQFRVTDQSGVYKSYYTEDGNGNSINVKMDIVSPEFEVDARSTKEVDGETVTYEYNSNMWSYNEIVYIITPVEKGESPVDYEYKVPGGDWTSLTQNTNEEGEYYTLPLSETTTDIEFRARSLALKTYTAPGRYHAYIDKQQPVVSITAEDRQGTEIRSFGTPEGEDYRVGYASDEINFEIYNRDSSGDLIFNESELYYQYKYTYVDDEGNTQETDYEDMSRNTDNESHTYYTFSDNMIDSNPIKDRTYTFRLESRSGLYDEKSFTASLIYSDFDISIDLVSRVENEQGWANAPIPVYINAPIMDRYTFAYTVSGTGYENFEKTFEWAADGSGDEEDVVKDVTDEFSDLEEDDPGYVEEGMAKYRIYITTSVERRYFKIYAYNAAEVKSNNEERTPEIRLDLVEPNAKTTAKIQHSDIEIESGDWANGNVELTLDSRDLPEDEISLSGIECELMLDENIPDKVIESELDNDGLPIGKFIHLVEIPEGQGDIYEKTLMFRLTSGSDLQSFIYFDIKIDKREIILNEVKDMLNDELLLEYDEEDPFFTDITQPVCKDISLDFDSNHNGHFSVWYRQNSEESYTQNIDSILDISIPSNSVGEIEIDFYLESYATDFEGEKERTNTYTLLIPYNCRSMNITVEIQEQAPGYTIDEDNWRNGPLSFLINLPADEEYSDYTYGIIILGEDSPEDFYEENDLTQDNQKSDIYDYCTPVSLTNGAFDFWGIDEDGETRFSDPTNDSTKTFYTGNVMIFAFNEAKYSSNPVPIYEDEIRIDNSTPDVTDMIASLNGEIDGNDVYNNETITLRHPQFTDRAEIEYYYYLVTESDPEPSDLPTSNELNGWTKLGEEDTIDIEHDETGLSTSYYLFGRNSLDKESSFTGEEYDFLVDPEVPDFNVNYPLGEGSEDQTTIDGETYEVFTFTWTEEINIDFSTDSDTGVYYWYSTDNMETWTKYNSTPSDSSETTFTFSDNINSTMFFKMTNQAGSEVEHTKPAVVRIDTRRPDFHLEAFVGGSEYDGGGYGSIDISGSNLNGLNLDDTSGDWANSTVTITINIDPEESNPSPVQYQYLVKTEEGETQYAKTPSSVVVDNKITFTTDRMDNFGTNNDAIIVVQARCPANGKIYTQAIRIKVDKVIPEFELKGEVKISEDSNQTRRLDNGEWTNQEEVSLGLERTNSVPNVSDVEIVYFRDGSSLENQWPMDSVTGTSFGMVTSTRTETIRVVAETESGLTYEQVFEINIDTVPPQIESGIIVPSVTDTPNTYYIDQPITYREENLKSAQYIVREDETVGFPLSQGHIIATNSVDNSEDSKGYVKIMIEDLAGNKAELEFYMIPFKLTINNLTLSQEDLDTIDRYEEDLEAADGIDDSRRAYFENLIIRLRDRETTLRQEIAGFQSYLAGLSQKASYELKSDYKEMDDYLETYRNYEYYDQQWIQDAIVEGEYYDYFLLLEEEYDKLDKQMERVRLVEENTKKLPAINVVEVTDYNDVLQVYDSYSDLSPDQKSAYATTLYNKLITLKRKCENMLLQDEDSGVKIEGNLAPGARIEVTEYPNTVELFNSAQDTILNTIDKEEPRTIVSINKVALTGAASQTDTGEIEITLPIPEEYYNYVWFAVYKLSPDGTVTEVPHITIQGDGKSLVFNADSLDTYVLATKANIEIREDDEDIYGTINDIEIDTQMLQYIAYGTTGVFTILIVVVIITALRRRRFLNHYNRAHKSSLYKKGVQNVPKGNKPPREHPFKDNERVKSPKKPIEPPK